MKSAKKNIVHIMKNRWDDNYNNNITCIYNENDVDENDAGIIHVLETMILLPVTLLLQSMGS